MEIKQYTDYLEQLQYKFPLVDPKDIKRICRFFWKSLYLSNTYGGDVFLKDNTLWCYIGHLRKNSLIHYNYYINKLCKKLRILYKRKKIQWDGYYYFALKDNQYENYQLQKKSRGRPRKKFKYGTVMLFKIQGECELRNHSSKYIFRVPYNFAIGDTIFIKDFISEKAELIKVRDPMKFKDILTTNNKYGIL